MSQTPKLLTKKLGVTSQDLNNVVDTRTQALNHIANQNNPHGVTPLQLGIAYGTNTQAATTAARTVTLANYVRRTGSIVRVRFTNAVNVANPTLNVNGTGAAPIFHNGAAITTAASANRYMPTGFTADFMFDGASWHLINPLRLVTTPAEPLARNASAGTSINYARRDHIHPRPTPEEIGAAPADHTHTDVGGGITPDENGNMTAGNDAHITAGTNTGGNGTAIGTNSRIVNSGENNTAIGTNSFVAGNELGPYGVNRNGNNNIAIGPNSRITRGSHSLAVGSRADVTNNNIGNSAIGHNAVVRGTGFSNTALGANSEVTNGTGNISLGSDSFVTAGNGSIALGAVAHISSPTSEANTAIGSHAFVSQGHTNTAIGRNASVQGNAYGRTHNNLSLGSSALISNIASAGEISHNVAIGHGATIQANGANIIGSMAIGRNARATHNNSAIISPNGGAIARGTTAANQLVLGHAGITVTTPNGTVSTSDARDKADASPLKYNALDFVNALKPTQYRMDHRSDYVRFEEIDEKAFEKLELYAQRHEVTEVPVFCVEGTDIEWIEDEAILHNADFSTNPRARSTPQNRYATKFISHFAKDKNSAIEKYKSSQPAQIQALSATAVDGEAIETAVEVPVKEVRRAKFLRVNVESDQSRAGKRYHNGFLAQEVEKAAKDMGFDFAGVQYFAHNKGEDGVAQGDDQYALGYDQFIAPLVGAVQMLSAKVEVLEKELKKKSKAKAAK